MPRHPINSTPGTALRLEFFRNSSCNEPSASFSWFFGEGQTLVGVQDVTTDADGNWNGTVALAGDTAADRSDYHDGDAFCRGRRSLAGSTSEFSECLADLAITKTDDPDPVAVGRPLTYTLDVVTPSGSGDRRPRNRHASRGSIGDVDHAEPGKLLSARINGHLPSR